MLNRINLKKIAIALLLVLAIAVSFFISWANNASSATDIALDALKPDAQVKVTEESGLVVFQPAGVNVEDIEMGFVFYPGGRVDYRAYAPILRMIAEEGFFVALVPAPLNLAFFNVNAAAQVQALYPHIKRWAVGGHSLGGVAAASFAANHPDLQGIVFWASYPANDALKQMDIKALSVYGTNDGLSTQEKIDQSRALLRADAQFVAIEGGNHGQFGSYGPQAGDNEADIPPEEQWTQIAEATTKFLEGLVH